MRTVQKSDTAVALSLTIHRDGVGGVVGKAPTVALRNAATTNSYLDFADGTFKTSGWTTKYSTMTEIERGHYQRTQDFNAATGISVGQQLAAEFNVNDAALIIGDAHEIFAVVEELYDVATEGIVPTAAAIATAVWDEALPGAHAAGTAGVKLSDAATVFNVDQIWTNSIVGGNKLKAVFSVSKNRIFVASPAGARASFTLYSSTGTVLLSGSSIAPNANGAFQFEAAFTPTEGVNYLSVATIIDSPNPGNSFTSSVGIAVPEFVAT